MSKAVAGIALVALGGTAVAGTAVVLPKWLNQVDAELPNTLSDFKQSIQDEGCVKSLFPTLTQIETTEDAANIESNFFTTGKKTTGCLVVNWDRYTKDADSENKWRGNFRFLWAVKGESKGFIVFLAGKTPTAESKQEIQWEGGIYKLEKSSVDPKKWTAKKQQEIAATPLKVFKKEDGDDSGKKFPQPGTAIKAQDASATAPAFWGFLADLNDLTKIDTATSEGAAQSPASSLRAYWSWESQDSGDHRKKLSDWSKDWDSWWNAIFDETKFKAKDLGEAQQGIWTNRHHLKTAPAPAQKSS